MVPEHLLQHRLALVDLSLSCAASFTRCDQDACPVFCVGDLIQVNRRGSVIDTAPRHVRIGGRQRRIPIDITLAPLEFVDRVLDLVLHLPVLTVQEDAKLGAAIQDAHSAPSRVGTHHLRLKLQRAPVRRGGVFRGCAGVLRLQHTEPVGIDHPALRHIDAVRRVVFPRQRSVASTVERTCERQVRVIDRLGDVRVDVVEVEPVRRLVEDHGLQQIAEAHRLVLCEPLGRVACGCLDGLLQQLVRGGVRRQAHQGWDAGCGDDVVGGELTYHWFVSLLWFPILRPARGSSPDAGA